MIPSLINYLKNKQILILGFGKEGKSTYQFLRAHLPSKQFGIADRNSAALDVLRENDRNRLITGDDYLTAIHDYDLIIKSPGISLRAICRGKAVGEITSQTDLFLRFSRQKVIGITGTKGKSTTASLIFQILKSAFEDVALVGNIGTPTFDKWEAFTEKTIVVYELSSYQLEYLQKSPHIAVLLNLFSEHLDHHGTEDAYWRAKLNVLRHQQAGDYFVFHADDPVTQRYLSQAIGVPRFYAFSRSAAVPNGCSVSGEQICFRKNDAAENVYNLTEKRFLMGEHNVLNMMAAITVAKILDVENSVIRQEIGKFRGLPHRLEYVGEYEGIHFYNDSISTIPETTIAALEALEDVDTLIVGGLDRGVSYHQLCVFLLNSSVRNIILLPDTGAKIWSTILNIVGEQGCQLRSFPVPSLPHAVEIAKAETTPGKICLLSPAAASYGRFKNFEERGETFVKLVRGDDV